MGGIDVTKPLELAQHFEPFMVIPVSASVADGQKMLQDGQYDLALIGDGQQPQTLVQASHLTSLTDTSPRTFSEVLGQLPPLVVIDGRNGSLNSDEIKQLLLLLEQTDAPGVVVYQTQQVQGVISWATLSNALPFSFIIGMTERGIDRGSPLIPARAYMCRKCAKNNPPPPFWVPRDGDEQPVCPRHWSHGPMQREDV
jgi:hypothetical protein